MGVTRSTRVFGVGSDIGRVLRSGRRLLPAQSVEDKNQRGNLGGYKRKPPRPPKTNDVVLKAEAERATGQVKRGQNDDRVDRMYGIVYTIKRRRTASASSLDLSRTKRDETGSQNGQFRSVMNSRAIQKRRSSLRIRKAHNPFTMTLRRSNRAAALNLVSGRKHNIQLSGMTSTKRHRRLANENTAGSLKESSSAVMDSTQCRDSSLCSTNILVIESDRCYREDGAIVTLEKSASGECLLTVKIDGLTRCTFKAEKTMQSWSPSRITRTTMFMLDNGWKLEFSNRRDWNLFRDLYKQCSDRNISGVVAKFIPIPGVHRVTSYAESNDFIFQRPATYISVHRDEITRAMTRSTSNYDMDSEDEEWLRNLNNEFQECVSKDKFELMIDSFEKVYHDNPDDSFDVKSAADSCQDLGSKEVVEAVYSYWMRKWKKKRSLLIRVFQNHSSKREPLVPKPLLQKKRSFKKQPSQFGRGNQPSALRAIATEQG